MVCTIVIRERCWDRCFERGEAIVGLLVLVLLLLLPTRLLDLLDDPLLPVEGSLFREESIVCVLFGAQQINDSGESIQNQRPRSCFKR